MDENEYRNAYHGLNTLRCVFEKSVLTLNCNCHLHEKFNLAEREGIRCTESIVQKNCNLFLNECRQKAKFALGLTDIIENLLPHSKEIQVQKGALLGLKPELANLPDTIIDDISAFIDLALDQCANDLTQLNYDPLIISISHHPARPKRSRRKK